MEEGHRPFQTTGVDCIAEVSDFTSDVFSDLQVDLERMTDSEKLLLEALFIDTYNTLAIETCDDDFRRVASVELVVSEQIYPEQLPSVQTSRRSLQSLSTNDTVWFDVNATNTTGANSSSAPPRVPQSTVFEVQGKLGTVLCGLLFCDVNMLKHFISSCGRPMPWL